MNRWFMTKNELFNPTVKNKVHCDHYLIKLSHNQVRNNTAEMHFSFFMLKTEAVDEKTSRPNLAQVIRTWMFQKSDHAKNRFWSCTHFADEKRFVHSYTLDRHYVR